TVTGVSLIIDEDQSPLPPMLPALGEQISSLAGLQSERFRPESLTLLFFSLLSSLLSSQPSSLRQLDLSNNDLKDSRVKVLSSGLKSPYCELETLRLSGCLVTEEGCKSLVSAFSSSSSHLKELDLSYNNPGEAGVKMLEQLRLDTLRYVDGRYSHKQCVIDEETGSV
ncbi:NACHT, LRR and PYD domains-containing protein 12-like, partial [Pundamilia nyererei]|uniref:NACHT, LRR and PYD domains-containing protein 12-like n=1 Tax=Pundamilia nyererei TaxID=303518 RepID=A0A9Y3SBY3_9CICH